MSDHVHDVVIIGGGPAGLSCALYAARAKLDAIVLDRGATCGSLAWATRIANYPGIAGEVSGADLLNTMRDQATGFGASYERATVTAIDLSCDPRAIYTNGRTYLGRAVVVATGSRGRAEKVEGEEEFLGRGVSYCATCDAAFYQGKVAGVVGNDEVAVEETLLLSRFASQVHLVCNKSKPSASADLLEQLEAAPNISIHRGSRLIRIVGDDRVRSITVRNRHDGEYTIEMDGVFPLLAGNAPITDFLGGALELCEAGSIKVDCDFATSVPGVYAVGDVTCLHPNQAVIAAASGVIAALAIDKYLRGRQTHLADYH